MIDSLILNDKEKDIFISLLNKSKKNISTSSFELIYRASCDGWNTSDFHDKCDNKGATICFIQTHTNNIFGGYTSLSWKNRGEGQKDKNAFIYLIRSSKNYKSQIFNLKDSNDGGAVYHTTYDMCSFGGGGDIYICSQCNINSTSYVRKNSYNTPKGYYLNGGNREFKVLEVEVFTVQ